MVMHPPERSTFTKRHKARGASIALTVASVAGGGTSFAQTPTSVTADVASTPLRSSVSSTIILAGLISHQFHMVPSSSRATGR